MFGMIALENLDLCCWWFWKNTFYNGNSQWTTTIWDSLFGSCSIRFFTANSSWPQGFCPKITLHFLIQGPLVRTVVLGSCFVSIGLWMQCIYGHGCFSGQFSRGLSPLIPPSWGIPGLDYTCRKSNMTGWQFPPWMNRCMDPIEDGGFSSQSC